MYACKRKIPGELSHSRPSDRMDSESMGGERIDRIPEIPCVSPGLIVDGIQGLISLRFDTSLREFSLVSTLRENSLRDDTNLHSI